MDFLIASEPRSFWLVSLFDSDSPTLSDPVALALNDLHALLVLCRHATLQRFPILLAVRRAHSTAQWCCVSGCAILESGPKQLVVFAGLAEINVGDAHLEFVAVALENGRERIAEWISSEFKKDAIRK